ncbi:MAG: hypothetical protein Ct9H300mP11_05360 [Chloroflexota bacterium]|nr:MAG: hypothetical protein Ct9H300mP11_05360 [Chloroflexota bacterium]
MLEQFKVTDKQAELINGDALRIVVSNIFEKLGVQEDDALLGADVLVLSDLRGVDSHGVSNMLKHYVTGFRDEVYQSPPRLEGNQGDSKYS